MPDSGSLAERFVRAPSRIIALAVERAHARESSGDAHDGAAIEVQREIGRLAGVDWAGLLPGLDDALCGARAGAFVRALDELGALAVLLPEVQALVAFHRSSPLPHKDLWAHTLTVVERTAAEPDLRWVALCHDIGKVATRAIGGDGRLGFHRHEAVGARLFTGIGARLGMPPERSARIAFVIEHHARTNQFEPGWSDHALRRLMRDAGEHLPLMLAFSAADWTTKKVAEAERIQRSIEALRSRLAALATPSSDASLLPPGLARALLAVAAAPPGPWVRRALRWAEDERRAGRLGDLDAHAIAVAWSETAAAHVVGTRGQG